MACFILNSASEKSISKQTRFRRFDEVKVIEFFNLVSACGYCLQLACCDRYLPRYRNAGSKPTYSSATIMATHVLQRLWLLSQEEILQRVYENERLIEALGYPERIISQSQYSRRLQQIGLLPYLILFWILVVCLIERSIINLKRVSVDSTIVEAFSIKDWQAKWSYPKKWKGSTFGYKIHLALCSESLLPIMLMCSSANVSDPVIAVPLLILVKLLYGCIAVVQYVYADSAYDTKRIRQIIECLFHATAIIDYNLRRQGKKFLVSIAWMKNWKRKFRWRATIERNFGHVKQTYRLNEFTQTGFYNFYCFAILSCIAQLMVAAIAVECQRPELIHQRRKVIANP